MHKPKLSYWSNVHKSYYKIQAGEKESEPRKSYKPKPFKAIRRSNKKTPDEIWRALKGFQDSIKNMIKPKD